MGFSAVFYEEPPGGYCTGKIGHLQLATARAIAGPKACTLLILVNLLLHPSEFASGVPRPFDTHCHQGFDFFRSWDTLKSALLRYMLISIYETG